MNQISSLYFKLASTSCKYFTRRC